MTELTWDGKYDQEGRRTGPLRVALPFQTVEVVNESSQDRQKSLELFGAGREPDWRNRLIWGDRKYVLPSLMQEFAGKVNLVYIDPPFYTGDNFTMQVKVDGEDFTKEPTVIEQKAYRDTWGRGLDSYLRWFYETVVILNDLLAEDGSVFVHLDYHIGHYAKVILDEVFGQGNFRNEIVWWYYNKLQGNVDHFARNHDTIFYYRKSKQGTFSRVQEQREQPKRQQRRVWDPKTATLKQARDADGKLEYYTVTERLVDDVWRLPYLMPADLTENLRYPTQKPTALVERVILAASNPEDLVLDCFCGSGTTADVAERSQRRWIAADIGRFAVHTTRKRLLSIADVRPFVVQNLGKYERQLWQTAEFGESAAARTQSYRNLILDLYKAKPIGGYLWLHGVKQGRMVHVGTVDAPVAVGDIRQIATEFRRIMGSGNDAPSSKSVDILGWDFAFELNEVAKQEAARAGIELRFWRIPREILDKRAVEQGDIRFFELAALSVVTSVKGQAATLTIKDFVIPLDDVPLDVQRAISSWTQWLDYWAVDWDYKDDTFHNQWQSFRSRSKPDLETSARHTFEGAGVYTVVVKVIDILGNDTTKALTVEIK